MKNIILSLSAVFLLLTGCTTMLGYPPLRTVVEIEQDGFEPDITIKGISERLPYDDKNDNPYTYMFLRSFINKENKDQQIHQIYVHYQYNVDWRFYNGAYYEGGKSAEFLEISSDVDCGQYGCAYYEDFAITIPDEFLRSNIDGFRIKAVSKSGYDLIITVSATQISEQLKAIETL